jgi:hypothetical protein
VHGLSDSLGIHVGGIQVAADPLQSLSVFLMVGISHGIEELTVTLGATDILRRTQSSCFDKTRVSNAGHGISDALDTDRVFPTVAKVVEAFKRSGADILQDIDQRTLRSSRGPSLKSG